MNVLDLIAAAIAVIAIILGWRSGAIPQVAGLVGAAAGAIIGIEAIPFVAPVIEGLPPTIRAVIVLSGLVALVGVGEGIGGRVGHRASAALGTGLLGALDRVLGCVVGAAQAALIVWLIGGVVAVGPFPKLAGMAQGSVAVRGVSSVLPPPSVVVEDLTALLGDTGLPDVFIGLEPLPAPDVALPSNAQAAALGRAAAPSVLRVIADACSVEAAGTAFVVSPHHLVTNAHVVVGASHIVVQTSKATYDAVPVLVDLELDIAVLYVRDLSAPVLAFTSGEPSRGDEGATFGYPGGGDARVEPATVAARYEAVGRDVLDKNQVTRLVLELRSTIIPGDSGGPLLLLDGTVGGVVFATSKQDPAVGYALAPGPVLDRISPFLDATTKAGTGPCVHT